MFPTRSSKGNKLSEVANSCRLFFSESLSLFRDKLAFHSSRKWLDSLSVLFKCWQPTLSSHISIWSEIEVVKLRLNLALAQCPCNWWFCYYWKIFRCSIWNCYFQMPRCLASITGCADFMLLLLLLLLQLMLLLFLLLSLLLLWKLPIIIGYIHWGSLGSWVKFLRLNHVK